VLDAFAPEATLTEFNADWRIEMNDIDAETGCSALPRRFSPDMKLRWMPTVDGNVIAGGTLPFSGFDTRREAVAAARRHKNGDHQFTQR
jgi:hypothetical protein